MSDKSHTRAFICHGLILALCTTIFSPTHQTAVRCDFDTVNAKHQHCGTHAEGVHDLDCFGKYFIGSKRCVWKPGDHTSTNNYTLVIQQDLFSSKTQKTKKSCRLYSVGAGFSQNIEIFQKYNVTAQVFENSDSTNCTKAVFRGSLLNLNRCGPPSHVIFRRQSGRLDVNVNWQQEDVRAITQFSVRYKTLSSDFWNEPAVTSNSGVRCSVENLNSSLVYVVQVQCVTNSKCSQCPWSNAYTIPAELKAKPTNITLQDDDAAEQRGSRVITLTWVFPFKELIDGYNVTISKASGEEPHEVIRSTRPKIRLLLSFSAYQVSISAFNNASVSSAASMTVPERPDAAGAGKLNVTVLSNTSFTIYWKDDLIDMYSCYCAEWRTMGRRTAYKSFHQDVTNYRTLTQLEPLEPYKRYIIILHTRTTRETCNLKRVNDSESTYASAYFYSTEGSPLAAPTNITSHNLTVSSVVLQWTAIPEDDIRGFLLGYTIHYVEDQYREVQAETNITVDPELNSYELRGLRSGTVYRVQIAGFTQVGAGVRSAACLFETTSKGYFSVPGMIAIFVIVIILSITGSHVIKRVKSILWPSIPNPGNSNTMQIMEGPFEKELLNNINTVEVEEWDTNSLQIIEEKPLIPISKLPSVLSLFFDTENKDYTPNVRCVWIHRDADDKPEDNTPDATAGTFSNIKQTNLEKNTFCAFPSGYTTMEMFQLAVPQAKTDATIIHNAENKLDDIDFSVVKSGLDYIRQSSATPNIDSEEIPS